LEFFLDVSAAQHQAAAPFFDGHLEMEEVTPFAGMGVFFADYSL